MKVVRNLLVVFGIIIITYGVMININRNKYTDMCTTVYVVKDEEQDHILDNGDFMVVRNNNEDIHVSDLENEYNSSKDFFKYMNRLHPSLSENVYDELSDRQKQIVQEYRDIFNDNSLSQSQEKERYNQFTQDFISASPMYNLVSNNDNNGNNGNRIRELRN
jgi:hypothetical protein